MSRAVDDHFRQFPPVHVADGGLTPPWSAPPGSLPNPNRPPTGDGPNLTIGTRTTPDTFAKIVNPQQYAYLIPGSILVTAAPRKFLDQSSQLRNFLGFTNIFRGAPLGCNYIIGFGSAPDAVTPWLTITDGQMVAFDVVVPQNDLYVSLDNAANTGGILAFVWSTIPG